MTIRTRHQRALRLAALSLAILVGALLAYLEWAGASLPTASQIRRLEPSRPGASREVSLAGKGQPTSSNHQLVNGVRESVQPPAASTVSVLVCEHTAQAAPVAGAHVTLLVGVRSVRQPGVWIRPITTLDIGNTDSRGRISGPLLRMDGAGDLAVEVSAPGYALAEHLLGAKDLSSEVRVQLDPAFRLAGKVQLPSGSPVSGARVSARAEGYPVLSHAGETVSTPMQQFATTDANGIFAFEGLTARTHDVRVLDPAYVTYKPPAQPGEPIEEVPTVFSPGASDVVLTVERLLFYRVRFVDSRTGTGIPCAQELFVSSVTPTGLEFRNVEQLEVDGRGLQLGRQSTDPSFVLGCVATEGEAQTPVGADLNFTVPGYTYAHTNARLFTAANLGSNVDIVELEPLDPAGTYGSVDVSAELPEGLALPDYCPMLAVYLKSGLFITVGGTLGEDKLFHFHGVPTSAHEVALAPYFSMRSGVSVAASSTERVTFNYATISGFSLRVEGPGDTRLFGAEAWVKDAKTGYEFRVPSWVNRLWPRPGGSLGSCAYSLKPGDYHVKVLVPGLKVGHADFSVVEGTVRKVSVQLAAAE